MIGHQRERQLVALPLVSPLNLPVAEVPLGRDLSVASAVAAGGTGPVHAYHRYRSNPHDSPTYNHNTTGDRSLSREDRNEIHFHSRFSLPFRARLHFEIAGGRRKRGKLGSPRSCR